MVKQVKKLETNKVEKGIERIGNKTGKAIGEKVYEAIRKPTTKETKGAEIQKILDKRPQTLVGYSTQFNTSINT